MTSKEIEIILPDDFHHHFRDNEYLNTTVYFAKQRFGRCIAMPNTVPPIRNKNDAEKYYSRIMNSINIEKNSDFKPLMTLYLTDITTPQDIIDAKEYGILACKLYPAGATTNSNYGVTSIYKIEEVLCTMEKIGVILLLHVL